MQNSIQDQLSYFSRAIGHPVRVAILIEIAKRGQISEGEQLKIGDLAPSTIIQHLRDLRRAGLIRGRIFGNRANYQLDFEALKKYQTNLVDFFEIISKGEK